MKDNILKIVELYFNFWSMLLKERKREGVLEEVCFQIYTSRKTIKRQFKLLFQMRPYSNQELIYILNYFYLNIIQQQYMMDELLRKYQTQTPEQIERTFKVFSARSLVLQVHFSVGDFKKIKWCSKNGEKILKYNSKMIQNLTLNDLVPNLIECRHDEFVESFFKKGFSDFFENQQQLWIKDKSGFIFTMNLYVKPYLEKHKLFAIANIEKLSSKSILINERGEIMSFNKLFSTLCQCKIQELNCSVISLFLFMPALLPNFLKFFYGLENFSIDGLYFEATYNTPLFVFKNLEKKITQMNLLLKNHSTIQSYCNQLYECLKELEMGDLHTTFNVLVKLQKKKFKSLELWELTILNYEQFTMNKQIFEQQFSFLQKIQFSSNLIYSIEKYQ